MKNSLYLALSIFITSAVPALSIDRKPIAGHIVTATDTMPKSNRKSSMMSSKKAGAKKVSGRVEEERYRNSATNDGTAINSSNVTNYNSDAVTNAPTGVGSAAAGPAATPKPKKRANP